MKRTQSLIAGTVLLLCPTLCPASFIIHLKDGREFLADRYWDTGEQIKFKKYGGVIGVQKDLVKGIEEIRDLSRKEQTPIKQETEAPKPETPEPAGRPEEGAKGSGQGEADQGSGEERTSAEQDARMAAFLQEKWRILEERERVSAAFREAKGKNDLERKEHYWNRLLFLQKELSRLRQEVLEAHHGSLPSWWDGAP